MGFPVAIRIALIDLSQMLGDVLADLVQEDVESDLVFRTRHVVEPGPVMDEFAVDGLVTRSDPDWEPVVRSMLARHPRARIVGVGPKDTSGVLYRLGLCTTVYEDISPAQLLNALKGRPDWTSIPEPLT
jgi:hypothetical protein